MKKLILILIIFSYKAKAQKSLLFEITHPITGKTSYLFGTIHVQDERVFNFNDSVYWAMDQCPKSAFELNLDANSLKSMNKDAMENIFDSTFIKKMENFMVEDLIPRLVEEVPVSNITNLLTQKVMPVYMEIIKSMMNRDNRQLFVDMQLQEYAKKANKEIVAIETFEEQINAFLGDFKNIDFTGVSDQIINTLNNKDLDMSALNTNMMSSEALITGYNNQDPELICSLITDGTNSSSNLTKLLYQRIFFDRNKVMFDRTLPHLEKGGIFVAVGAGHLCGNDGLLKRYKSEGYKIRAVNVSTPYKRDLMWNAFENETFTVDIPHGVTLSTSSENNFYLPGLGLGENSTILSDGVATFSVKLKTNETSYDYAAIFEQMAEKIKEEQDSIVEQNEANYQQIEVLDDTEPLTAEEEAVLAAAVVEAVTETETIMNEDLEIEKETREVIEQIEVDDLDTDNDEDMEYFEIEDYERDSYSPHKRPNPMGFASKLTDEQLEYFADLKDSLQHTFKSQMMGMMGITKDIYKSEKDTFTFTKGDTLQQVYYSKSMLGNNLKTLISNGTETYELTISGDNKVLKSEDILRFFKSFEFKL